MPLLRAGPGARSWHAWGAVLLALALAASFRLRLLDVPLERDEGEYAYAGQLLREGIAPYRLAYNMKFPGTYAAYALGMTVLGESVHGIHLTLLVVNALSILLLFVLVRRIFDASAAAVAAIAFAALSLSQSVEGVWAHATHFVVLASLAGLVLLARALDAGTGAGLVLAGTLLGLAPVMKQHGVFFPLLGVVLLVHERLRRRVGGRRVLAEAGWLLLGVALPLLATGAALWWAGVFERFRIWTFGYAREYVLQTSASEGFLNLADTLSWFVPKTAAFLVLALVGAVSLAWDREQRARAAFSLWLGAVSLLSVCPGLYFRPHYFVSLLPALALFVGLGAAGVGRALERSGFRRAGAWAPALLLLAALGQQWLAERAFLFQMTPEQAARATYGANPFPEAREVARHLSAVSSAADRIAVLGSEPEIYFYTRRRSATGHIYMYGLMESSESAARMQEEAIREIEAARPEFLVVVNVNDSWGARPGSPTRIFSWAERYVTERYVEEGLVEIFPDASRYRWGADARGATPAAQEHVWVYRRRPGAD